ncbi:unnamed protein product [Arabis nemorensis]|uniref:Uncharacterized protein n=1 Tax=Arabis nemorensis TaxID=586526 RepID=A0A565B1Z2_9BRAS|nr:unnamed protein product [Arabis nemorensis]
MSLAIADVYTVRKFHKESMKKPAKPAITGDGGEKIVVGGIPEAVNSPVKQSGSKRFGRWFVRKPGMKKSSAKVSDPMTIE